MKLLVVDTETTGLSARFNKLLTVGLLPIEVNQERLEILGSKHIFVKHKTYNADSAALKVNKINLATHDSQAIEPAIACKEIQSFITEKELTKTPILGHNVAFDRGFLNVLFEREGSSTALHHESVDTMHLWRNLKQKGRVPFELRSNLGAVAGFFGVDYTKAHDALADCHITAQVYQRMLGLLSDSKAF